MKNPITPLSIKALLTGSERYVIPMYQRNYAWGEGEISQLIDDVIDSIQQAASRDYHMGSLVVYRHDQGNVTTFETIDGQQRLTTLALLAIYLKKQQPQAMTQFDRPNIDFASRPHSIKTFAAIAAAEQGQDPIEKLRPEEINADILHGYHLIQTLVPQKLKQRGAVTPDAFREFLLNRVQIMRVEVPDDTDLNHYFEIMNSRGEQLEKHEVLKARLLNALEGSADKIASQACLHRVWEACANMEKYVQMGFSVDKRELIFAPQDWGTLQVTDFDALSSALHETDDAKPTQAPLNLTDILKQPSSPTRKPGKKTDDESPERFSSVVTFPHFLLHVLRVETGLDVPLDDKRLLSAFEEHVLKASDPAQRVKAFTYNLLRCKLLYDHCIIKREFLKDKDGWSLKRLTSTSSDANSRRFHYVSTFGAEDSNESLNRRIRMLLGAFHVSMPTQVYKHWLNAALHYLFSTTKVEAQPYLQHMESVAKAFVFDRYLADKPASYYEMIYTHGGKCRALPGSITAEALRHRLSFDNIQNNLVFNFLDYLLWNKHRSADRLVDSFEFTFRSSVEHYYPRNPHPGIAKLEKTTLDSFGNLCLISHSKNSRLSNFTPDSKKEYYTAGGLDSVKQYLMMKCPPWDADAIGAHEKVMIDIFESCLASAPD